MIVNLIGPPAAGKSTFASRFVLEHPYFTYCAIDGYRAEYDSEEEAWHHLFEDLLAHKDVVVESCGLDHRLEKIFNSRAVRDRNIMSIAFYGRASVLVDRLKTRQQKRPIPFDYDFRDEIATVDWVLGEMTNFRRHVHSEVDTVRMSQDEVYDSLVLAIMEERLKQSRRKRKKDYIVPIGPSEKL